LSTLRKQGLNAIFWDILGKFSNQLISLVVSIFLARLIEPEEFGLVGMVLVIIPVAQVFMNLGFGAALIQKKDVDQLLYSSVFWLNISMGITLTLILFYSAPFIANFYHKEELTVLIKLISIIFTISSFGAVQTLRFTKELEFKTQSIINSVSAIFSGILGIYLAYLNYGVYALVYQKLFATTTSVILYWIISKWRPNFQFSIVAIKSVWGFSIKFFIDGFLSTIYSRLDVIMIGKIFQASTLGFYSRAQSLDTMVNDFSSNSLMRVFFPLISKIQGDLNKSLIIYKKFILVTSFVSIGLTAWLFVIADELFIILFTEKWIYSAHLFKLMAVVGFIYPLSSIMLSLIEGLGYAGKTLIIGLYKKSIGVAALIVGFLWGLEAFLYACIFRNIFGLLINMLAVNKVLPTNFSSQFNWFKSSLFIASGVVIIIVLGVKIDNIYLSFFIKSILFIFSYLILTYFFSHSLTSLVIDEFKKLNKGKEFITRFLFFIPPFIKQSKLTTNYIQTRFRKKKKVFVIGFNKTGTTSIKHALKEMDYIVGNQSIAEQLMADVVKNDYNNLIHYCKAAEAFQDVPFSLPEIYKELDVKFPNSKFILTIRDSDEQWFNSICKFHSKYFGVDGNVPTKQDLENADYAYKGFGIDYTNYIFGDNYYNKIIYTQKYNEHNTNVINYFKNRPTQLLVLNVSDKTSYQKLCAFLNVKPLRETFEWKNKTTEL